MATDPPPVPGGSAAGREPDTGGAGFGSLRHLGGRLVGSLRPGGPSPADEAWAKRLLGPGERKLWDLMSGPDRRHAVGVARAVALDLGGDADGTGVPGAALAAALLHDVGKIRSGLGTWGRVAATAAALRLGRDRVAAWSGHSGGGEPSGWRARAGLYVCHDALGAAMLEAAGAAPLTVAWAAQHHLPSSQWTVDPDLARVLKAADGD